MAKKKEPSPGLKARLASGITPPAGEDLGSPQKLATFGMKRNTPERQAQLTEMMKRRQDELAKIDRN